MPVVESRLVKNPAENLSVEHRKNLFLYPPLLTL